MTRVCVPVLFAGLDAATWLWLYGILALPVGIRWLMARSPVDQPRSSVPHGRTRPVSTACTSSSRGPISHDMRKKL